MRLLRIVTCAVLLVLPATARAQASVIEKLLEKLTHVDPYLIWGGLTKHEALAFDSGGAKDYGMYGVGLEFSFKLGQDGTDSKASTTAHPDLPNWLYEVGVAYSQLTGFRARDPKIDLRGSIRELPVLSFYITRHPERRLSQYVGMHVGLVQLQGLNMYDSSGTLYSAGGSTWEVGGSLGFSWNFSNSVSLVAEPGYTWRRFAGLDWSGSLNGKALPQRLPRSLSFQGFTVSGGLQIKVNKK
jgi:hypothetical protein